MTRFWDGRTDGRSDCTPRPSFAFGDAGKNDSYKAPPLPPSAPITQVSFQTGFTVLSLLISTDLSAI